MNLSEERYSKYALCREMLETAGIVGSFDAASLSGIGAEIAAAGRLLHGRGGALPAAAPPVCAPTPRKDGCCHP